MYTKGVAKQLGGGGKKDRKREKKGGANKINISRGMLQ